MDYLKSTKITSLFDSNENGDSPTCFEVPSATTKDVSMNDDSAAQFEDETDEEQFEEPKVVGYDDLAKH